MRQKLHNYYDILIAGAGFAGSLTALILQKSGLKVCLLEKDRHPRFAIGESSTPVADMILRNLSQSYDLPWLRDFSRYGSWQQSHPEIVCGIKRGFSFFKHYPGKEFFSDEDHTNELLVAASSSDTESDTNWLRSDFDAFLAAKVKESGIHYFDLTEITRAIRNEQWEFHISRMNKNDVIYSSFFIDATGSSTLLEKLRLTESSSDDFLTNSFAVFSHFNNIPRWTEMLQKSRIPASDFPYDPDKSALHQILDEGWLWMLRFNDQRTSMGFVLEYNQGLYDNLSSQRILDDLLAKYPTINDLFKQATLASTPGQIMRSQRLQRRLKKCFGEGWVALPNTAGFVDPLFSSGIAQSLSGIEKLAAIFHTHWDDSNSLRKKIQQYETSVFAELKLIDCLVAGCYKTLDNFQLFNSWSMFYFAVTIAHEQRRLQQKPAGYFLNADDPAIRNMVYTSYRELIKIIFNRSEADDIHRFTRMVKERIKPFNIARLLDSSLKNMYRHTAAVI